MQQGSKCFYSNFELYLTMKSNLPIIPGEVIMNKIYYLRGQKVMLDRDLAELYGVQTKALNQAVKRNSDRFPEDFMFTLTEQEADSLRSQFVTLKRPSLY